MSKSILSVFSSRSFIVSGLTFKSLIHFEFSFVHGVENQSSLILLHIAVRFSQHHFLKKLYFPIVYACLLCHKLIGCMCVGSFLGSVFCSIYLCICFCASTILFDDLSLVVQFKNKECDTSSFVLLSQDCLGYSGSFVFKKTTNNNC